MIVTYAIQQGIKPISANNQGKFDQISTETEALYLPKYLGRAFANAVQKAPESYVDLLDGLEFTDCDGNAITFKGLKYILAYFIFAEYIDESKFADTFTGFVVKNRNEAQESTQGQESKLKTKNRKLAEDEVEVMRLYLNENYTDYPLWDCVKKVKAYNPRFTEIKRTL